MESRDSGPTTCVEEATPTASLDRIRRRYATTKQRELETALKRLDARGDLSGREEAVVEEMADRIVAGLLAPLTSALDEADREEAADMEARLRDLYDLPDEDA